MIDLIVLGIIVLIVGFALGYIIKEKKQEPPRSWEEFYNNRPLTGKEHYISSDGRIFPISSTNTGDKRDDKNWCTSKEEAEAFLALMQLRRLRKAWVGDWEPIEGSFYWGIYKHITMGIMVDAFELWIPILTFPAKEWLKISSVVLEIYVKPRKYFCNYDTK